LENVSNLSLADTTYYVGDHLTDNRNHDHNNSAKIIFWSKYQGVTKSTILF